MPEKEWFTDWFDSEYYHLLYCNRDENEAENFIAKLAEWLAISPNANVLDIACGKGRHSKTLARLGFNVWGIDLSSNSIAFARQYSAQNLHFDVWDMRQTYRLNHFDLAVNLFSSFGYLPTDEDNLTALKAIVSNLKTGGILVLDYMNAEAVVKTMQQREIVQRGNIQFHIKRFVENGFVKKSIDFVDENGTAQQFVEQLRIIKPETFRELFREAGLKINSVFGDYQLCDFDPKTSPRQVIVAKKV